MDTVSGIWNDLGTRVRRVVGSRVSHERADHDITQGGCCSPATSGSGCGTLASPDVHGGLAELLKRYDVNDSAVSVNVYAVKP